MKRNPCENLRVERHPPVLSKIFLRLMSEAIQEDEKTTKILFNIK